MYCWFTLNRFKHLFHIKELFLCISVLHKMPVSFSGWFFQFFLLTILAKMYYLIEGEDNKNKNLNCPVFCRNLHFYGHLVLFNYMFFASLAKHFPQPQMSIRTHLLLCFLLTPCRLLGLYSSSNWIIWVRKNNKICQIFLKHLFTFFPSFILL